MVKVVAGVIAALVAAAGLHWGTFAVGGSDSYCYAYQAERWASGSLQVPQPLALRAPWPSAPLTFTPAGHVPSPTVPGAIAPICPVGLSLAMAPFRAAGGPDAIFLVVPLFGALLAWSTFVVGSRISSAVGISAMALTCCSPIFLFQLMQPMSDVPAAACWTLAVALVPSRPLAAGLAASAAILTRPNLVPLGVTIGVFLLAHPGRSTRGRLRDAAAYAAGCIPGCVAVALVQHAFYGSVFGSGYGSPPTLFALDRIRPNAARYATWLWQTHTPFVLLAPAAPFLLPSWTTGLWAAIAAVNIACYLPYVVFDDWWYLRFLLPSVPLIMVLAATTTHELARRVSSSAAPAALAILTPLVAAVLIGTARDRSAFELWRLESRYVRAGRFVARRLPVDSIVITSWESGSIRYYSGRTTLVWDTLDPAWLDRAVAFVRAEGYQPFLVFERWEEQEFRKRFAASPTGALDWPPAAEIAGQVRVYRPGDRARYFAGAAVPTEYVR